MPEFKIPLFDLNFDETEAQAAAETVRSGWISMGPKTAAFEELFARHVGSPHGVCLSCKRPSFYDDLSSGRTGVCSRKPSSIKGNA